MIKGVNKQVLEINETQNSFFEKAIFFVKPEYSGMSEGRLREKAKQEFNNIGYPPSTRMRHNRILSYLLLAGSFFVGVISGIAFCTLL